MKKFRIRISNLYFNILLACSFLAPKSTFSCTILSAIASDGQVWNANNEDGPLGIGNFINVFPKTGNAKYGYYTLSYFSAEQGQGANIQGGTNEAGLTFDFNAITKVKDFDPKSKKAFPNGDEAILPYILATMNSTQEVIDFFNVYWFQHGFRSAQMHVADRQGRFAIISASGVQLVEKGQFLISTNFDICGNEDGSSCWRYPIAKSKLSAHGASLSTMMAICRETAQKNGTTMYSNIQNLTTGDVWFFSKHDPNATVNTNISEMLARGARSYSFSDLKSLTENRPERKWVKPDRIDLADSIKNNYTGTYYNSFTGNIEVNTHEDGIEISFEDGNSEIFQPQAEKKYFFPHEDVVVEFNFDKKTNQMTISMYENGIWMFTAWQKNS